jgi:integrase/recombinase XerC/integrase/recombinase XerD
MNDLVVTQFSVPCAQSLDGLIDRFLNSQDIKQTSKTTYRRGLVNFFSWLDKDTETRRHGDTESRNLNRETILRYKKFLEERRGSPLTLSTYLVAVRRFFEWAESIKLYPNVAKGIRGSKRQKGFRKDNLTVDQAKALCSQSSINNHQSTIEELRDLAMVNLMIRTGLRTIEVIRADIEDLRQEGGEAVLYIQGKGRDSKDEFVLLTEGTLKPIRDYLTARGSPRDSDPLFCSLSPRNMSGRLTTRSLSRICKGRLRSIGLDSKRLTAHSLRHSAATFSLIGGAKIEETQTMMRHSSIDTTMIYAHHIKRLACAPERRIDDVLAGV